MYLSVADVKPLEEYKLMLTFENNEKRIFDVSKYLDVGKFVELRKPEVFHSVKVKFDSI